MESDVDISGRRRKGPSIYTAVRVKERPLPSSALRRQSIADALVQSLCLSAKSFGFHQDRVNIHVCAVRALGHEIPRELFSLAADIAEFFLARLGLRNQAKAEHDH